LHCSLRSGGFPALLLIETSIESIPSPISSVKSKRTAISGFLPVLVMERNLDYTYEFVNTT
jgi:hypothetical protein